MLPWLPPTSASVHGSPNDFWLSHRETKEYKTEINRKYLVLASVGWLVFYFYFYFFYALLK